MNIEVKRVKIFATIPTESTNEVREAACKAGAGIIGNYSFCSTSVKSLGTFIPNEEANPYIGKSNRLEFVEEDKLEIICDIKNTKHVIEEIRRVHPYEEPGIDIVPLIDEDSLI